MQLHEGVVKQAICDLHDFIRRAWPVSKQEAAIQTANHRCVLRLLLPVCLAVCPVMVLLPVRRLLMHRIRKMTYAVTDGFHRLRGFPSYNVKQVGVQSGAKWVMLLHWFPAVLQCDGRVLPVAEMRMFQTHLAVLQRLVVLAADYCEERDEEDRCSVLRYQYY